MSVPEQIGNDPIVITEELGLHIKVIFIEYVEMESREWSSVLDTQRTLSKSRFIYRRRRTMYGK
jgi:hypothetical protein